MQKRYHLEITGGIWMPYGAKAATTRDFTAGSDKDALARVDSEAGDFSSVDDFRLTRIGDRFCKDVDGWTHGRTR